MNKKQSTTRTPLRRTDHLLSFLSILLILIALFTLNDLIHDIRLDQSAYELRFERDETFSHSGNLYRLYVEGDYRADVDYNRYSLTDENGNTDCRYCTLIEDASRLTYTLILCAMLYLVIMIARNSLGSRPFTRENIRLIKAISILQLLLAVLPGTVRLILTLLRFDYFHSTFDISSLYLLAIAFVIAAIAFIFERGLALQEDVDSIA